MPKDIPAAAFWSLILYDNQSRSMLQTPQKFPRAGSQTYPSPAAVASADGSTTVYLSPTQPPGVERGNWIQTMPGRGWFTSIIGSTISTFDSKTGKPLSPETGYNFDGKLGAMQGIMVANSMSHNLSQLCGVRSETFPPGLRTGDAISPEGGYIAGLQTITGVAADPAGNVWVANSWDQTLAGFKQVPDEALSTRFASNTTVVFFGLAKPVRTPMIGPAKAE